MHRFQVHSRVQLPFIGSFTWDGRDAYNRAVQGEQPIRIRVGYAYPVVYTEPALVAESFGVFGGAVIEGSPGRSDVIAWQEWTGSVGTWDARAQGLGGWTLDIQHAYDPTFRNLYLGNGTTQSATDSNRMIVSIQTPASPNSPYGIAAAPDGSIYYADNWNHQVYRVEPDGSGNRVAGTDVTQGCGYTGCNFGYNGDGIPAVEALLNFPAGIAVDRNGSIYIADKNNHRVRHVGLDGIISTVAGTGEGGYNGDNILATQAKLNVPYGVAIGSDGCLYIGDTGNNRIRRVSPDGKITTVAGIGEYGGFNGDNIMAPQAALNQPRGIAFGPDGSLYIADVGNLRIRRVVPDGIITTVAGSGPWDFTDDGNQATLISLHYPTDVVVGRDGSLFIAEQQNHSVRRMGPDGVITTIAGSGVPGYDGDGGLAAEAKLEYPSGVSISPEGDLFVTDLGNGRIRRVSSPFPELSGNDSVISAKNGKEIYAFDWTGRHLRTVDSLTRATIYQFTYDPDGNLVEVGDADNNATRIERNASGDPTEIVAPGGQRTELALDTNGYLFSIANPAGDNVQLVHDADGLLDTLVDPRGYEHIFAYDPLGRLVQDSNPAGGFTRLDRIDDPSSKNYSVWTTTALGRETTYRVEYLATGETDLINTWPGGSQTITRVGTGGTQRVWFPDNTVTETVEGPDPRFGMLSPITKSSTTYTANGLVHALTVSRSTVLADPNDLLSLRTQTDIVTVNDRTYTTVYDNATLTTRVTSPVGRESLVRINPSGKPVSVQVDNTVLPTTFAYYVEGHPHKGLLHQKGQGTDLWAYQYDDRKRLWKVTDPLDNTIVYGYDNADRVVSVILPSGRTYGFNYDAGGNRSKVIMPSLAVHDLGYSPVNLDNAYVPPYVPPGNLPYAHFYSPDREWMLTTLPSGRPISAGYDPVSARFLTVSYPEGAVGYGYSDNMDRVFELTRTGTDNSIQIIDYDYDGFLTTKTAFGGVSTGEFLYAYDNNFWTSGMALDNTWNLLSRDDDGLLTGYGPFTFVRGGPAGAPDNVSDLLPRTCALDNAGLPAFCPPGTLDLQYGYDNMGRLARRTQTVNGTVVYVVVLDRDPVGRITRKTETLGVATSTFEYGYDVDGQLIEVRKDGTIVEQYGYDNNANRNVVVTQNPSRILTVGDFDYDPQDRLGRMGTVSYVFDADGYLANRGLDNIVYSARGELLSVTTAGQAITYQYDGTARRVARTDTTGTTQYLYGSLSNPFQVTASRAPDNTLTVYYYDDFGALYALERGGVWYYVGSDHLGTPKVITDNTGAIVRQLEYDSWGVKISDTNPGFDLPVGFAGGIPDDLTGLVRFGFRDYEPASGRWTAKDPIFFRGGLNLFQYVANDPVNTVDPYGTGPCPVGLRSVVGGLSYFVNTASLVALLTGNPELAAFLKVNGAIISVVDIMMISNDYGAGAMTRNQALAAAAVEIANISTMVAPQKVAALVSTLVRAAGNVTFANDLVTMYNKK